MAESLPDSGAEIERVFLWEDIVTVLRANADKLGIQASFDSLARSGGRPTRMVLAETPQKGTDTLQLWTEVSKESLISKASLLYIDSAGQEVYNYEISPTGIKQYSPEPTPLDKTDLRDLRQDVIDAEWHEGESQECAASLIFFG